MSGLFWDPAPLYSTNDRANYYRAKVFFFILLPILFSLYFHFGDMLLPQNVSWSKISHKLVHVLENNINKKEFEVFNSITNKLETITIARDSALCFSDSNHLDRLLLKWGIRLNDNHNEKQKIDLLLKISHPHFWRINYFLHPKRHRIKHWLSLHKRYLNEMESIKELKQREKQKTEFIKFRNKLKAHSEYEDLMLFKFIRENIGLDIVDVLSIEHQSIHQKADEIVKRLQQNDENNNVKNLMENYEKALIDHFSKEEQEMVHIMLNLDNALYRRYRSMLSWKYYFIY